MLRRIIRIRGELEISIDLGCHSVGIGICAIVGKRRLDAEQHLAAGSQQNRGVVCRPT